MRPILGSQCNEADMLCVSNAMHRTIKAIQTEPKMRFQSSVSGLRLCFKSSYDYSTQSEKCICDPDSFALYCEILKAKQHISKTIKGVSCEAKQQHLEIDYTLHNTKWQFSVNCERPFGNKDQQFRALMENFDRDYMDDV